MWAFRVFQGGCLILNQKTLSVCRPPKGRVCSFSGTAIYNISVENLRAIWKDVGQS